MPRREPDSRLSESDYNYYGWRVVLAACFGVMEVSARSLSQ